VLGNLEESAKEMGVDLLLTGPVICKEGREGKGERKRERRGGGGGGGEE